MLENLRELITSVTIFAVLRITLLLVAGFPVVFLFSRWLRGYIAKKHSAQQGMVAGKTVLYTGVLIIVFSILNEFGFKLTHVLAAAGVLGIAIGFAAQTSFSNIISGLFLIGEQPFVVGDTITVGSTTGDVLAVDMLAVKLRTFDNKLVRIPNETILKSEVTNLTHFPIRRIDLPVGIAYKEDVNRVREILFDIARKNPKCLEEPPAEVRFAGFGDSSIDLMFIVWIEKFDFLAVKNEIREAIKEEFDREGIEIPFPHVSIYTGSASTPFPVEIRK